MQYELERVDHIKKLPMKCMTVSIENSNHHWHYDYEVIFVLQGSITLQVGTEKYVMQEGDIVLINACEIHSLISIPKGNLCLVLQFDTGIITEEYGSERSYFFDFNTVNNDRINKSIIDEIKRNLAKLALTVNRKADGYHFLIKSYLYKFISDLFAYTKYDIKSTCHASGDEVLLDTFDMINQYIKSNLKRDFTVMELCNEVGISKSSLYRILKETTSATYKDLVDFYRIEYSKNLLKNTRSPISYIASVSGFDSDASFYRSFKKSVGVSPNIYRNDSSPILKSIGIQGYITFNDSDVETALKKFL